MKTLSSLPLLAAVLVSLSLAGCDSAVSPPVSSTDDTAQALAPARSGNGNQITFDSNRDVPSGEIYVMNADGSDLRRLTTNGAFDGSPSWSPNGKTIAFVSGRDGNGEIYVMNADGTGQTNLTNHPAFDSNPVWSPNGKQIAFRSGRDGNSEIYVMDADGSDPTNLSNHPAFDGDMAWSTNGKQLAFESNRDGALDIFVMNADGSGTPTNITNDPSVVYGAPAWSTNGRQLAFHGFSFSSGFESDIFVTTADGSGPLINITEGSVLDFLPDWTTNGRQIVFQSGRDGNVEIYVMDADGSDPTNLTTDPAFDGNPNWSR